MPSIAFALRDYSTRQTIRPRSQGHGSVFVPRRHEGLPALRERSDSSYREDETIRHRPRRFDTRNYFPTALNSFGDVVANGVPAGAYTATFRVDRYVEHVVMGVPAPTPFPIEVLLHRAPVFGFSSTDTVLFGLLDIRTGQPPREHEVVLQDSEANVPLHRVPVGSDSQFVIYAPEKKTSSLATLRVDLAGQPTGISAQFQIVVHRQSQVPSIVVT